MTGRDGGWRSQDLGRDNDSRWKTGGGRKHIFDLQNSLMVGSGTESHVHPKIPAKIIKCNLRKSDLIILNISISGLLTHL